MRKTSATWIWRVESLARANPRWLSNLRLNGVANGGPVRERFRFFYRAVAPTRGSASGLRFPVPVPFSFLAADNFPQENVAAHYFLWSVACQRSGDQSQAKAAIVQALEREPTNPQYQQQYLTLEAKR